jgi:hypothetical protein
MGTPYRSMLGLVTFTLVGLAGCGPSYPGFQGIYPGMTGAQVSEAMGGRGPATVTTLSGGYSAWYFNKDQCVLMKDNAVVDKHQSETQTAVSVPGIGGFSSTKRAKCLPPGQTDDSDNAVSVGVPGAAVNVH